MLDKLIAGVRASHPTPDEPSIIQLLRRLVAANDRDGVRAIRAVLHGEREASRQRYSAALSALQHARLRYEETGVEHGAADKLAALADAIDGD